MMKNAGRRRSLIVPREHGAWGILLVPLITGAAVGLIAGGDARAMAPLSIAVLALFWLRTPVESWIGNSPVKARTAEEFALVRRAVLVLTAVSAGALAWLFWGGQHLSLLWIGVGAAAAFAAQGVVKRASRVAAQTVGAAGLTAVAAAAYFAVTGHLNDTAWSLWIANFLFATNQIQFVQLRIRSAHAANWREKLAMGQAFAVGQVALVAFLVFACAEGLFPWYSAMAFLPVLFRGFEWFVSTFKPLAIHALGKRELLHACIFGVLLILGFGLK